MIKVSIIVPIYNVEQYLKKSLDCLCNQTLKDIEIICVNDCSTDNSLEILKEYEAKDNRIKVISFETNLGAGYARNKGIEIAQGEYLYFMDPDDKIELTLAEQTYSAAKDTNADIVLFDFDKSYLNSVTSQYQNPTERLRERGFNISPYVAYNFKNFPEYAFNGTMNYPTIRLYNTNFIRINNLKFGKTKRGQDKPFSINAKLCAERIIYINKLLYHYKINKKNPSISNNDIFCIISDIQKIVYNRDNSPKVIKELNTYFTNLAFQQYLRKDKKERNDLMKELREWLPYNYYKILLNLIRKHYIKKIFSVTKSHSKKHLIITFLGLHIKIRIKPKN